MWCLYFCCCNLSTFDFNMYFYLLFLWVYLNSIYTEYRLHLPWLAPVFPDSEHSWTLQIHYTYHDMGINIVTSKLQTYETIISKIYLFCVNRFVWYVYFELYLRLFVYFYLNVDNIFGFVFEFDKLNIFIVISMFMICFFITMSRNGLFWSLSVFIICLSLSYVNDLHILVIFMLMICIFLWSLC